MAKLTKEEEQLNADLAKIRSKIVAGLADQFSTLPEAQKRQTLSQLEAHVKSVEVIVPNSEGGDEEKRITLTEYLSRFQGEMYEKYPFAQPSATEDYRRPDDWIAVGLVFSITKDLRDRIKPKFSFRGKRDIRVSPGRQFHSNETGPESTRITTLLRLP